MVQIVRYIGAVGRSGVEKDAHRERHGCKGRVRQRKRCVRIRVAERARARNCARYV